MAASSFSLRTPRERSCAAGSQRVPCGQQRHPRASRPAPTGRAPPPSGPAPRDPPGPGPSHLAAPAALSRRLGPAGRREPERPPRGAAPEEAAERGQPPAHGGSPRARPRAAGPRSPPHAGFSAPGGRCRGPGEPRPGKGPGFCRREEKERSPATSKACARCTKAPVGCWSGIAAALPPS